MNLVVQFSMSCAFRCIALRLAAYLLYHFVVRLSRGFSSFFQVFFVLSAFADFAVPLSCSSDSIPHSSPLVNPFLQVFSGFSIFPAGGGEKVTALGLWVLYWLHQWGIPRHTCRFYWLLAGAVGKRQGIAIPYPSPTPLLTPWGIRCGGEM